LKRLSVSNVTGGTGFAAPSVDGAGFWPAS
jgi:hypothetical protein